MIQSWFKDIREAEQMLSRPDAKSGINLKILNYYNNIIATVTKLQAPLVDRELSV